MYDAAKPLGALAEGTFDIITPGHVHYLETAAAIGGGTLTVGVNSDQFVTATRGRPPAMSEQDRMKVIAALRCVTMVTLNSGDSTRQVLDWHPRLYVAGSDWAAKDLWAQTGMTREWLALQGCSLVYVDRLPDHSSTAVREAVQRVSDFGPRRASD